MVNPLNYWQPILAVIVTGFISYGLHGCSMDRAEKTKNEAVEAQRIASKSECTNSKLITEKVDNALQNSLGGINIRLNDSLVRQATCAIVQSSNSTVSNHAASGTKHAGQNGLSVGWLRQYAATCEAYRVKVIASQTLFIEERK